MRKKLKGGPSYTKGSKIALLLSVSKLAEFSAENVFTISALLEVIALNYFLEFLLECFIKS